jgi:hypothetical protein
VRGGFGSLYDPNPPLVVSPASSVRLGTRGAGHSTPTQPPFVRARAAYGSFSGSGSIPLPRPAASTVRSYEARSAPAFPSPASSAGPTGSTV